MNGLRFYFFNSISANSDQLEDDYGKLCAMEPQLAMRTGFLHYEDSLGFMLGNPMNLDSYDSSL